MVAESHKSVRLAVSDASQIGEARRAAVAIGVAADLGENELGRLALIVSEAATNIVRHGGGGEVVVRRLVGARGGVEVLAIDRGSGIDDIGRAMRDGFSTSGTAGSGLGAISRQSSYFDVLSARGAGTIVLSQIWKRNAKGLGIEFGAVCLPVAGEQACGDDWNVTHAPGASFARIIIADGLGHGAAAELAAVDATRVFEESHEASPSNTLELVHAALRGGRGAAVAVGRIDTGGSIEFAGLGNIAGSIRSPAGMKSMVSQNGTAGHSARRFHSFMYEWPADGIVVLHSDGMTSHWNLDKFPGLARRHPALIAGALYRDFSRGRDDVTVVVCRRASDLAMAT